MNKISLSEIEQILNIFESLNFDLCLNASLHSSYKEVSFHKGFEACICCLKDYYKIKKDIDIFNAMLYL